MADTKDLPPRHLMRGTADADTLRVADLVGFDWVPDPGDTAHFFYDEIGHVVWNSPSRATGQAVFEGVSAAEPFTASPAALRFAFTDGVAVGTADLVQGAAWSWSPGPGLLDPRQASAGLGALNGTAVLAAGTARYEAVPDMLFVRGATDAGHWALRTSPLAVEVLAGAGADSVLGGDADDRLLGEAGDDLLDGGGGADRLVGGNGGDRLIGGPGNDTIEGQRGADLIEGGDGNDLASGGSGNDTLQGGAGADILIGHAGDDVLEGGAGADLLIGGTDRDTAAGRDAARYAASPQRVSVDLAAGRGTGGDAEGDRLLHIRDVEGSGFADSLLGDAQDNRLRGGGGADTLAGRDGADTLWGGRGADLLDGGAGEDTAAFAGRAADFAVTLSADGRRAWVRDLNLADGDEGADELVGIEHLQFADRTIPLPAPPAAAERPRAVLTADDGATGRELWVTDGTAAGTRIVADLEPGRDGSNPYNFAAFGDGRVVFSAATTAAGREAWVTDGTAAGTRLLQDIGPGGSGSDPWGFAPLQDGRMLFAAAGPAGREPWITDGTAAGTHMLRDIDAAGGSSPGAFAVLRPGLAVFSAGDAAAGREPWVTDGTAAGTHRLADLLPGTAGSDPYDFTPLGTGQAVFSATGTGRGNGLWITDGTAAGTRPVPDVALSDPYGFFPLGDGRAVFQAATAATGTELWITDGSTAGTRLVKDIAPGPARSFPTAFTALGDGRVVFDAYSDAGYDREPWVTDGTAAGTQLLRDIWPGPAGSFPQGFTGLGDGRLVFAAETWSPELLGRELWITDGTAPGTRLLRDLWPGTLDDAGDMAASGNPYPFLALGQGRVIFGASDPAHGAELWTTDGTAAGTVLVADINPVPGQSSGPAYLTLLWPGGAAPAADLALIA